MRIKEYKHFNWFLFDFVVDSVRSLASKTPRTLTSRLTNIVINFLGEKIIKTSQTESRELWNSISTDINLLEQKFNTELSKVSCVSFDIFDTLLLRKIQKPIDLFLLMEAKLQLDGFAKAREIAEQRARANTQNADVTLEEIYRYLPLRFQSLLSKEKEFEEKTLFPNPFAQKVFNKIRDSKIKIVVTSDMYLDSKFLRNVLESNGYTNIEEIFVSCEQNASKNNGKLFDRVAKNIRIPPYKITHIGDNYKSDVVMAKKSGFSAFWLPPIHTKLQSNRKKYFFDADTLSASLHNSLVCRYHGEYDIWHEYGYMLGGPLVLAYLQWVINRAELSRNDHLAFVGRDGWILKQIYDKYLRKPNIISSYIHLPRRISLLSTLQHNGSSKYIKYILQKAREDNIPGIYVSHDNNENLTVFQHHLHELQKWSNTRRLELEFHLKKNIGTSSTPALVDLTTLWLTSFSAAHTILKKKNTNNYALWFLGSLSSVKIGTLPFESAIDENSNLSVKVCNPILGKTIHVVDLIESFISSPEKRILELKDGQPVYGDDGEKKYYNSMASGIEEYVSSFLNDYIASEPYTFSVEHAVRLFIQFAMNLDKNDYRNIVSINHASDIDNKQETT